MIFPERLKQGDTIGLVAPSFPIREEELADCIRLLEEMGYRVKAGRQLTTLANFHNYLAGEGKDRAADINGMFADPEVKAIFCVRGGYGSSHVMDYLDYDLIRANPKIFLGYSDITNLLSAFQMRCEMVTFHGPMVCSNMRKDFDPYTRESLFAALNMGDELEFRNPPGEEGFEVIRPGKAEGMLTGGNLSLLSRAIGTSYQLNTEGKILFMEDIEEPVPVLDMYLTQMRQAGMFAGVKGILLGDFTACTNDRYDASYKVGDLIRDWFKDFTVPVMCHVRSGHDKPMGTLPMGTTCRMDTESRRILFKK